MKIGALIVTTGLPRVSGVAALTPEVGTVTAGQRMIAAFQRVGVSLTGLVTGPEDKKTERLFAQCGVIFLRCGTETGFLEGVRQGLSFMQGKFDRVFVVPGDMPLFLPETLEALLAADVPIAVPVCRRVNGCPVLLSHEAVSMLLSDEDARSLETALEDCSLKKTFVPVEDPGVLLRGSDMTHRSHLIQFQNRQLTRSKTEITLSSGTALYDQKLAMLLHLVQDTRSVRLACSLMQMSYSTAWNMLNHVEDALGYPLVIRIRGGAEGSGSVLTEKGQALMEAYDRYTEAVEQTAQRLYGQIFRNLAELS